MSILEAQLQEELAGAHEEIIRLKAAKERLAVQLGNLNRTAAANLAPLLERERRQAWHSGYAAAEMDLQLHGPRTPNPHPHPEDKP